MTYPLMDALESAVFRMSLDELSQVEVRRHGRTADLLSRAEILRRIYCPHERYLLLQRGLATRVTVRVATFHELTASEVAGYSVSTAKEYDQSEHQAKALIRCTHVHTYRVHQEVAHWV